MLIETWKTSYHFQGSLSHSYSLWSTSIWNIQTVSEQCQLYREVQLPWGLEGKAPNFLISANLTLPRWVLQRENILYTRENIYTPDPEIPLIQQTHWTIDVYYERCWHIIFILNFYQSVILLLVLTTANTYAIHELCWSFDCAICLYF